MRRSGAPIRAFERRLDIDLLLLAPRSSLSDWRTVYAYLLTQESRHTPNVECSKFATYVDCEKGATISGRLQNSNVVSILISFLAHLAFRNTLGAFCGPCTPWKGMYFNGKLFKFYLHGDVYICTQHFTLFFQVWSFPAPSPAADSLTVVGVLFEVWKFEKSSLWHERCVTLVA